MKQENYILYQFYRVHNTYFTGKTLIVKDFSWSSFCKVGARYKSLGNRDVQTVCFSTQLGIFKRFGENEFLVASTNL